MVADAGPGRHRSLPPSPVRGKVRTMLNTVIVSDLHFGEPYNLAHDQGVPPLLDLIKAHAAGHLRRLVLAGDIFEMSTPESMELVHSQARFFLREARSRFRIDSVIWVPGNHD